MTLQVEGIDWASVTPNTPCTDVTKFLFAGNHCSVMKGDVKAIDIFCSTFDSCVVWDDYPGSDTKGGKSSNATIDCSSLSSCSWDGFHSTFIGDGVCHDKLPGCYNSKICGYDGGDCCSDTCISDGYFVDCGTDGFACRDPKSKLCNPSLSSLCPARDDDLVPKPQPICATGEALYRLVMYDSFGDGWDQTKLTIALNQDLSKPVWTGGLKTGAIGTEFICLSKSQTCYHVDVKGGTWGNEVSWEIKASGEGTPAIADGGAPTSCTFPVNGDPCSRSCSGKPTIDPTTDPDYKTYKEMFTCIEQKCLIQVGSCRNDAGCLPCFSQDAPEFCFANDNFNAVIDCGLCTCNENENKEFCDSKATPGAIVPPKPLKPDDDAAAKRPCSAAETLQGSSSVMTFAKCSNLDQIGMMVTDFDENNFGSLDSFETCAHSFSNEAVHGGRTALGCMQILANAIDHPGDDKKGAPVEAIAALAKLLYHNAEGFCDCAIKANADCPLCPSFHSFKTLLYESLDACKALDEIDCDAWNEFYTPCKSNVMQMFGNVDFSNRSQCDYVKDTCGGAGPFPAFRKLDCGRELPKSSWDFYSLYAKSCLQGNDGIPPEPVPINPVPATSKPIPPPVSMPTIPPAVKPDDGKKSGGGDVGPKPYVPPDDDSKSNYVPKEKKKKHHFFRNVFFLCIIGGVGYYYYKKRQDAFSFVRYRRGPRNFGGESEMYSGLAMDSGSASFEPPSLPPPPSAIDEGRQSFL